MLLLCQLKKLPLKDSLFSSLYFATICLTLTRVNARGMPSQSPARCELFPALLAYELLLSILYLLTRICKLRFLQYFPLGVHFTNSTISLSLNGFGLLNWRFLRLNMAQALTLHIILVARWFIFFFIWWRGFGKRTRRAKWIHYWIITGLILHKRVFIITYWLRNDYELTLNLLLFLLLLIESGSHECHWASWSNFMPKDWVILHVKIRRLLLQILLYLFLWRTILQIAKSFCSCQIDYSFRLKVVSTVLTSQGVIQKQVLKGIFKASSLNTWPKVRLKHGHYNFCTISADHEPWFGCRRRLFGIFILTYFWNAGRRVFRVFFGVAKRIFQI